ncbi:MAE_28990/MAE_18760 family HEPN-like nuclease [Zobellia roscoffensis]|uniref:MAE_28990/MAE_18760 family HEPN-like nuclease n=1 Tax=Zobellia roscoffensis TaxID=2779508 RepID=UPI00188C5575|nr:MAE_28990/MAE_18760 family HEPN-like nuclease [Zobellia roscoffensis]
MRYEEFESFLDEDLSWRKKEVSELFLLAKDNIDKETLRKSLILLLYSHWEGYIKKASKLYIKYISEKKIKINLLSTNFTAITLKSQISKCIDESANLTLANELTFMASYIKKQERKFKININPDNDFENQVIDTHSNLKPKVFKNIIKILGLSYKSAIETREHYIDSHLLSNRNSISHGNPFDHNAQDGFSLTLTDIEKLKKIVFSIIDNFRDELLDYADGEFYKVINNEQRLIYIQKKEEELENIFVDIES